MKRFKSKWLVAALALAVVPAVVLAGRASALVFTSNTDKTQTVNSSIYSANKDIDIGGTVNGDIFCVGQNINIDATVHGDVICAGQNITVSGKVDGNVRLAGQDVSVDANVSRSATVAAMSFSLDANASVGRDMTANGQTVNLKGKIGRDAFTNGSDVILNGSVGRDVEANTQNLRLKNDAVINGKLKYRSQNKLQQLSGAKVLGATEFIKQEKQTRRYFGFSVAFFFYILFASLVVNLVLALLFPRLLVKTSAAIKQNFGKSVLVGLLANLILPFLLLAALISVIGIPFGLLAVVVYALTSVLGVSVTSYYVGRMIFKDKQTVVLQMLVGSALLTVAFNLPWVGFIVGMIAAWVGIGAILMSVKPYLGQAHKPGK